MGRLMLGLPAAFGLVAVAASLGSPIVPDSARMSLDEIGLYSVGYAYRGRPEALMPYGWSGHFDDPTGISCLPFGTQAGRQAFLLHSPWRNGTGVTFQEFRFALPKVAKITLTGFTAMRSDVVDRSDGSLFRIRIDGQIVYSEHRKDATWKPFSIPLTRYGGRQAVIRFENDPGPKDDPSFDYSLWGDRTLVLAGFRSAAARRYQPPPLSASRVSGSGRKTVVPSSGFTGRTSVALKGTTATFRYTGPDGVLEYVWDAAGAGLGALSLKAMPPGAKASVVPLARQAGIVWTEPVRLDAPEVRRQGSQIISRRRATGSTVRSHVTTVAKMVGKSLVLEVAADDPKVVSLSAGDWGPVVRRRQIPAPYYGAVNYLSREQLFAGRFLDWTSSAASRHTDATAHYETMTDGSRNRLSERIVYSAAWHLAEVLPNIPNAPSPFLQEVGGKIVLDVWGGRYTDIAASLAELHSYGIRNAVVLIHDWQRSGYDNALPMHIPAAADKGGDDGMRVLVATAVRLGYRIALHENYVDYYPNYDGFDENHIALDSSGKRVPAWYNPGTRIQSFAVKPNAILPLAATQSPEIHARYGTNANYLDVHSAVPPWFHVDFRAGEDGAGRFRQVFDIHRKLWEYERQTHHGPVFGEGNAHWYWSGMLDGVEAQFGTGWPANQGLSAPLMVDFNLLKVHPLQINHGQGYYERWWDNLPWGAVPPMAVLDQYRLQEVLYGHAGFLGASTWNRVPFVWLEHHLMTPVTSRHAGQSIRSIDYFVDGQWLDMSSAARARAWGRPRVVYANGLTIIGNNASGTWRIHGATLPQHGWIAHGGGVTAYTAVRDGVVVDYAETQASVFANARPRADWNQSPFLRIRPRVASFSQTGARRFACTYTWTVNDPVPADYSAFVHFSAATSEAWDEGIRFQQDHGLTPPTRSWKPGSVVQDGPHQVALPDDLPDGSYEWTIGLFSPPLGRAAIDGKADKSGRILLGTLIVADHGARITLLPATAEAPSRAAAYSARLNDSGKVVQFGAVRTNGSVYIRRDGADWVASTWPRASTAVVDLSAKRFGAPRAIRCIAPNTTVAVPVPKNGWWRLPLSGAREYRWQAP